MVRVQAESFVSFTSGSNGNIVVSNTSDTGGGQHIGNVTAGATVTYSVAIATAGNYRLDARIANGDATPPTKQFRLAINNQIRLFTYPTTGGWNSWTTLAASTTVNIPIGTHNLILEMISDHTDFNWFDLTLISIDPGIPPGNVNYNTLSLVLPVDSEYSNQLRIFENQFNGGVRDRYLQSIINPFRKSFRVSVLIKNGQEVHKFLQNNRVFYLQGYSGLFKRKGYSLTVYNSKYWKLDLEIIGK